MPQSHHHLFSDSISVSVVSACSFSLQTPPRRLPFTTTLVPRAGAPRRVRGIDLFECSPGNGGAGGDGDGRDDGDDGDGGDGAWGDGGCDDGVRGGGSKSGYVVMVRESKINRM